MLFLSIHRNSRWQQRNIFGHEDCTCTDRMLQYNTGMIHDQEIEIEFLILCPVHQYVSLT